MEEELDQEICKSCGTRLEFDPNYDALFCPMCNEWRDELCGKKSCEFCGKRPEKPVSE
ncbi:hypothetical protein [Geobacter sp.]|uniref:hypothetical protein n=1 Tax=Geobacter sp. TaxID=46610 RepID=UPI0026258C25|nr:hypothetical protein [Geobacter sp.]